MSKGGNETMNRRKKPITGRILKTTDGKLRGKSHIRKPRLVVVVYKRDDGCIAVCKLFGSDSRNGERNGIRIKPTRRNGLTKESIVEPRILTGFKKPDGIYVPYREQDFHGTGHGIDIIQLVRIRWMLCQRKDARRIVRNWRTHYKKTR